MGLVPSLHRSRYEFILIVASCRSCDSGCWGVSSSTDLHLAFALRDCFKGPFFQQVQSAKLSQGCHVALQQPDFLLLENMRCMNVMYCISNSVFATYEKNGFGVGSLKVYTLLKTNSSQKSSPSTRRSYSTSRGLQTSEHSCTRPSPESGSTHNCVGFFGNQSTQM